MSLIVSLALFILPVIGIQLMKSREMKRREQLKDDSASLASFAEQSPIRPPLPKLVQRLLSRCRLSYLSTIDVPAQSSHLSLMRFTYLLEEEVIIMSTNRKTKKFAMLEQQRGVSLLVHDFGQSEDGPDGEFSITLNGKCHIVQDGEIKIVHIPRMFLIIFADQ